MNRTGVALAVACALGVPEAPAQEDARAPAYELVPLPREIASRPGSAPLKKVFVKAPPGPAADDLRAWLQEAGAALSESGRDATEILLAAGPDAAAFGREWADARPEQLGDEGYLLTVADRRVRILANGPAGLFYGVQTLRQWAKASPVGAPRGVRIRDWPAQGIRGFKGLGPRWDIPEYIAMAGFMARFKLNFLMVCYVSFEESFNRFRDPYPPALLEGFRRLADACRARCVTLCVCINPGYGGGNIRYSGEEDYARLRDKCLALLDAGVRWFSIALDDIDPPDLVHAEDKARFKSLAEGQSFLVNRLLKDLQAKAPDVRIVFCPTLYAGVLDPSTPYYVDLRRDLSPEVRLFWTGPGVFTGDFRGEHARTQARTYGRPPFVWDNYPVTDHEPLRKSLGPFTGRAADLPSVCCGYMANSMRHVYLSQFPYVTLGDYLWNPEGYRPERSHAQAVLHLGGPAAYAALREMIDLHPPFAFGTGNPWNPRQEKDLRRVAEIDTRMEALRPGIEKSMPDGPLKTEALQYVILNFRRFARVFLAWGECLRAEEAALGAVRRKAPSAAIEKSIRDIPAKLDALLREGEALEALQAQAPPKPPNIWALPEGEDYIAGFRFWMGVRSAAAGLRERAERWLRDPASRERAARGWELDAAQLQGGKTWPGLAGVYVYAAGTGADVAAAAFTVEKPSPGGFVLRVTGKDDDPPGPCTIRVSVNGKTLHEGHSGFPDATWSEKSFPIPASALVAGENRVDIRNLETRGSLGMPPWFGVQRVSLEPAAR